MTFHRSDQLWCDSQLYIYISTLQGCDIWLDLTVIFHWRRCFTVLVVIFHSVMLTVIFQSVTYHSLHNWYNHHGWLGVQNQLFIHVSLWLSFGLNKILFVQLSKQVQETQKQYAYLSGHLTVTFHSACLWCSILIMMFHFDCAISLWPWCSTLTVTLWCVWCFSLTVVFHCISCSTLWCSTVSMVFHSDCGLPPWLWYFIVCDCDVPLCVTVMFHSVAFHPDCDVPLGMTVMPHSDCSVPRCVADVK